MAVETERSNSNRHCMGWINRTYWITECREKKSKYNKVARLPRRLWYQWQKQGSQRTSLKEKREMVWAYFVFVVVLYCFWVINQFLENLMEPMDPLFREKKNVAILLHNIQLVMDTHGIDCQKALEPSRAHRALSGNFILYIQRIVILCIPSS